MAQRTTDWRRDGRRVRCDRVWRRHGLTSTVGRTSSRGRRSVNEIGRTAVSASEAHDQLCRSGGRCSTGRPHLVFRWAV